MTREEKNAHQRAYVERNRDAINARRRADYAANPEKVRAKVKKWQDENREHWLAKRREEWARNAERNKPRARAYYRKNREILLAKLREKNATRGAELWQRRKELWAGRPEMKQRAYEQVKEYYARHPEMKRLHYARRLLAQQSGLPFADIPDDLAEAKLAQLEIMRLLKQSEKTLANET